MFVPRWTVSCFTGINAQIMLTHIDGLYFDLHDLLLALVSPSYTGILDSTGQDSDAVGQNANTH